MKRGDATVTAVAGAEELPPDESGMVGGGQPLVTAVISTSPLPSESCTALPPPTSTTLPST